MAPPYNLLMPLDFIAPYYNQAALIKRLKKILFHICMHDPEFNNLIDYFIGRAKQWG